jgi:hypothetical protein
MPYHIVTHDGDKGQVVKSATRQPMSKKPIPLARAYRQLKALYANEGKKGRV